MHDVKWYLAFILLIVFGFSAAFHILYRQDQDEHEVKRWGREGADQSCVVCTVCTAAPDIPSDHRVSTSLRVLSGSLAMAGAGGTACMPSARCACCALQDFRNIGTSFVLMITWLAGNADLTPMWVLAQPSRCMVGRPYCAACTAADRFCLPLASGSEGWGDGVGVVAPAGTSMLTTPSPHQSSPSGRWRACLWVVNG